MIKRDINPQYILSIFKRRWFYFLIPFFAVMAGAIAAMFLWPPVYSSTAMVMVESQRIPQDLVQSTVQDRIDPRLQIIEQRLRTAENLLRIANKFELLNSGNEDTDGQQTYSLADLNDGILIERVEAGTRRNRETIAFTVSFEHGDPEITAGVANELVSFILSEDARTRNARASVTTRFLVQEQTRLERQLKSLEQQISDFKIKNKDSLPESLQYNLNFLERSRQRLQEVQDEIAETQAKQKTLQISMEALASGTVDTEDPAVQRLFEQLEQLQLDLAKKEITFTNAHPEIRRLRSEVAALQGKLEKLESSPSGPQSDESATTRSPVVFAQKESELEVLKTTFGNLKSQEAALAESIARLNTLIGETPQVELKLNSLDREYESLKSKLVEIAGKQADAVLGQKLEANRHGDRFEVLEEASTPTVPVKPNRLLILAVGLVFAVSAGGALIIAQEVMDDHIRSPQDMMLNFDVMPIVTIPNISKSHNDARLNYARAAAVIGILVVTGAGVYLIDQHYLPMSELKDRALNLVSMAAG